MRPRAVSFTAFPAWGNEGEKVWHFCQDYSEMLEKIHRQEEVWADERGGWVFKKLHILHNKANILTCDLKRSPMWHSLRHPVQCQGAEEEQHQQELCGRLPRSGAEARIETVSCKKGACRLRRFGQQVWSPVQGDNKVTVACPKPQVLLPLSSSAHHSYFFFCVFSRPSPSREIWSWPLKPSTWLVERKWRRDPRKDR